MILLSSFQFLGPSQKLFFKFSIWKLKTKVENRKVGLDFSFKFSAFGTIPKIGFQVFNSKVESQSWKPKGRAWFFFQVFNFWDHPKNWFPSFQLESGKPKLKTRRWDMIFLSSFQLLGPSQKLVSKLKTWKKNHVLPSGFQLWFSTFKLKTWRKNQILPLGFQLWFSIFKLKTWKPIWSGLN